MAPLADLASRDRDSAVLAIAVPGLAAEADCLPATRRTHSHRQLLFLELTNRRALLAVSRRRDLAELVARRQPMVAPEHDDVVHPNVEDDVKEDARRVITGR